jgi:hypothetical protein
MPQLRGDARRRVMRQFREFVERQPRFALPRAQQYVAKHISLPPSRDSLPFPSSNVSHHLRLLSRRSTFLSRKLFRACIQGFAALLTVSLVEHPRRAVGVFVVSGTSAARAQCRGPAVIPLANSLARARL